jgi:serine/threonine protein kinase/tetratricopeptide (TPR) repeat protein
MPVESAEVRSLFERAVDLTAGSRRAFVERNCDDPVVRAEVMSLLEYDLNETQPPPVVRTAIGTVLNEPPVQRVGAFELGELLGSGGMGFVYEAHRMDGQVRQRVAVKFVQVSPAASKKFRESAYRRFARERQMLASLRHPYIAGLIDAGTTPEGIPYAVIEQVDGVPIDTYCDTSLPTETERIQLFLKLCDAVQFAHRNLVVHSDIKPDNVLVTADGIPKLIDFGVANDLALENTTGTMPAFTPGYASPEQCLGVAATVATDVYGLGAVLYRLLTGVKPREFTSDSIQEAIRRIRDEEVVPPSAIKPECKGDLENILLKALQRDPHRRYGSVPEFADDLNRYLARRPVRASPDSIVYRASRFMRRHWLPLTATAIFVAALAVATAVSVRERRLATARAADTRRLSERLLFEVHDEIGGLLGGTKAREKLGNIAVQYLEALERDHGRDPELAWELLNAYSRLGQSRGGAASSLGDTKGGSDFAAKTLALGLAVESANPDNDRLESLFGVYDSLMPIFLEAGRRPEAREAVDRMLRLAPRLRPLREAQAFKQLARYFDANHQPRQASDAWARSLSVLRRHPNAPAADTQLVSTLVGHGRAQSLAGDFTGAVSSLREAIQLAQSRTVSQPQMAKSARQLYWSHIALGDVLGSPVRFSLGQTLDAVAEYQKARSIAERLVHADPANDMAKLDLARAFSREGMVLAATQPAVALQLLERSHAVATQTSSRNHSGLDSRFGYLTSSVLPLVQLRQFDRADVHVSEARRLAQRLRQEGVAVDEKGLLIAEEVRLHATGRTTEALAEAKKHLERLPLQTRPVLSENYPAVELLERMRVYSAGSDAESCALASERLARIWADLQATYPTSAFVRAHAEREQLRRKSACEARPALARRAAVEPRS